jgi:hypothetical protein
MGGFTMNGLNAWAGPAGSKKSVVVSGDTDLSKTPCRMITATAGSVVYVDINASDGLDQNVPIPPNFPCINIIKVYNTGTDCSNMRAWPME